MPSFASLLCTDEAVALAATQDYPGIVPNAWRLCQGTDGVATGFSFTSTAIGDWSTIGVAPGMVINFLDSSYPKRDMLAIAAVSGTTLSLRRLGLDSGAGRGPALASGKTAFTFEIASCYGAITEATRKLRQRYRITAGDAAAWADATEDLKCAAVEMVLCQLYGSAHQMAGLNQSDGDNYRAKYKQHSEALASCLSLLDSLAGDQWQGRTVSFGRLPALGLLSDADSLDS